MDFLLILSTLGPIETSSMFTKLESLLSADTQIVSPRPYAPTPTQHALISSSEVACINWKSGWAILAKFWIYLGSIQGDPVASSLHQLY